LRAVDYHFGRLDGPFVYHISFSSNKICLNQLKIDKTGLSTGLVEWIELSMGMSGDYLIAAELGATLVRVGSAIYGPRH
jgi:uncharacterized pyridoxal phosphate-containing UPF0001 family protein